MNPKIELIRREIANGTYETPQRLSIAAERMLDDVIDQDDRVEHAERWDGME